MVVGPWVSALSKRLSPTVPSNVATSALTARNDLEAGGAEPVNDFETLPIAIY